MAIQSIPYMQNLFGDVDTLMLPVGENIYSYYLRSKNQSLANYEIWVTTTSRSTMNNREEYSLELRKYDEDSNGDGTLIDIVYSVNAYPPLIEDKIRDFVLEAFEYLFDEENSYDLLY